MMITIIAGGRDFTDYPLLHEHLKEFLITEVVSGGARGADRLGEFWARDNDVPFKVFRADWNTHGKKAGILRNIDMGDYAERLIAFWDGKSKGTKHMIAYAKSKGLDVHVVYY